MNNNESIINLLKHQIIYKDTSQSIKNEINTNRFTIKQEFLQDNYESIYLLDEVMILGKKKSVHRLYIKKVIKGEVVLFGGWICDNDIDNCMVCNYMFNFIYRSKHHCRSCGNLVCTNCSPNTAIIQGLEVYHHQRVCVQCYWGQDIVYPIESMISNYILTNQSTSDESDDDNTIQFDLIDIYLDSKSIKKKDSKMDNQIDIQVVGMVDSKIDSKVDWKVSNDPVDSETDSEIESYLLSEITKEYQKQLIVNQLTIDSAINDFSAFDDDKSLDSKSKSKVNNSKINSKLVNQLDITIDSKLNSPIDSELNDYSDSKLTISSSIINSQIKKNPLLSNKSSITSKRLSSRTFSFTTLDSSNYSSSVSVESVDKVQSLIDNQLDSSKGINLDDCIDITIHKQLDDLLVDGLVSKKDGKIHSDIDSTLDSKLYDNLNNQLVSIILNQVDSYTDTNIIITADNTIDSQINISVCSNIEIDVNNQIDINADCNRESKIESDVDSNIDGRIDCNANSRYETKLVSNIDRKVNSSIHSKIESLIDSTADSNIDSKVDIKIDSQIDSNIDSIIDNNIDSNIDSNVVSKIDSKTDNTTDKNTHECIYPLPGKVIKTKQIKPLVENSKLFINLCHHSIYPLSDTADIRIDSMTDSPKDDLSIYLCDIKIWNNLNFRTIDVLIRTTSYEMYLIDKEIEIKLNQMILSSIENRYAISLDFNISYPKTNNNYKGDINELIMYVNNYTQLSSSVVRETNRYDSYEDSKFNDMELDNKVDTKLYNKIDSQLDNTLDNQINRQSDVQLNSKTDCITDSDVLNRRESLIDSELYNEVDRGTFSRPSVIPKYLPSISNSLFRLSNNVSKIPNRIINFLETNEVVIYSAIVGKKSPIGLKLNQERELVLTNYPRLLYHDVRSNKPPRQVLFSQTNKPIVEKVSKYVFQVKVFDPIVRVFEFTDRVNGSQTWIDHINSVL